MALLRNRPVNLIGPSGPDVSPTWTVTNPDGTREDTPLKNLQLSDSELKQFTKDHGERLAWHVRPISDKEHQEILDSQNPQKIHERVQKGEVNRADNLVKVTPYVKTSDVEDSRTHAAQNALSNKKDQPRVVETPVRK
jgi:hypothetical protein